MRSLRIVLRLSHNLRKSETEQLIVELTHEAGRPVWHGTAEGCDPPYRAA